MIGLRVDASDLRALGRALRVEENGKLLRRDLTKEIRRALAPAVKEAKAGIRAMSSTGGGLGKANGPGLRQSIARQIRVEARLSGRTPGARVKAKKIPNVRGFANAAKRTNRARGWRHPVFGRDVWAEQIGRPGWFDDPMKANAREYRAAVVRAMASTARRITRRV